MRAATELGITTVALYTYEDRYSLHRYKADEAYQIGFDTDPLKPYLGKMFMFVAGREKRKEEGRKGKEEGRRGGRREGKKGEEDAFATCNASPHVAETSPKVEHRPSNPGQRKGRRNSPKFSLL